MTNQINRADTIEASDLGWAPGYFAQYFAHSLVGPDGWTRVRVERDREGETLAVHYLNTAGDRLVVLND